MKIGFLGTGHITIALAKTVHLTPGLECYAIASRTPERAEEARQELGFQVAYGSYEELLNDPQVELVYLATPHSHHYQYMKLCLEHGKPVLCEKAFTVNARQAEEIRQLSRKTGVLAAEALWTRYMPSRRMIQEILDSGIIGKVTTLTANLFYPVAHRERLHNPELAGGALLDVGVYAVNFALMHFGMDIVRMESSVQMLPTGVDGAENITFFYADGRTAFLSAGILARSDRRGVFYGSEGYMVVDNINNPARIQVFDTKDTLLKDVAVPAQITGYEYEFLECAESLRENRTETRSMPLSESVRLMEIMDALRAQWGLVYPMEKSVM